LKKRVRSVLSFGCWIVFYLSSFTYAAAEQSTTQDVSKLVFINLDKTPSHFIEDQEPADVPAPGFYSFAWHEQPVHVLPIGCMPKEE
jgi:hypothetical protein